MKKVTPLLIVLICIALTCCTQEEIKPSATNTNGGITHEDTWNTQR